jgi:hypothetical protein
MIKPGLSRRERALDQSTDSEQGSIKGIIRVVRRESNEAKTIEPLKNPHDCQNDTSLLVEVFRLCFSSPRELSVESDQTIYSFSTTALSH